MSVYTENGYSNRREIVDALTSIHPASEDFDGLVTQLEDHRELWRREL